MKRRWISFALVIAMASFLATAGASFADSPEAATEPLPSLAEARGRARLLHEAMHATLHVVHHQYYREDEGLLIPATTLKKVFRELSERKKVELRWLAVNAQAMSTDHIAESDFERAAVKALAAGADDHETVDGNTFRYAGKITLGADCLKCHLPSRTSTKDRAAALVISFPMKKD